MAGDKDKDALALAIAKRLNELEGTAPVWDLKLEDAGEGWARTSMLIRDDMLNGLRTAHGGMIFALADTAFAYYLERYEAAWGLYPDVAPCLAALEGDGHALGVISNGDSDAQRRKLERMGLADRLPTVAISGDIGVAKPAAALFEHACRLAGRAPADCLYIGDRLDTDARAARRAGLRGVFLDRNGVGAEDVPRIGSLAELPTLLSTLA